MKFARTQYHYVWKPLKPLISYLMSIKSIFCLLATYSAIGLILWMTETNFIQCDVSVIQKGIIGIATGFLFFTTGELLSTDYVRRVHPDYLLTIVIGTKSLRFLITLLAIIIYGMTKTPGLIMFSINICLFYIVSLTYTTILNLLKNKQ